MTLESQSQRIDIPGVPDIPGLIFRRYRGESDLAGLAAASNASDRYDGNDRVRTVDEIRSFYGHLNNCLLETDMAIAEVNGAIAGFVRVEWRQNDLKERLYVHNALVRPEWRRRGIGAALLRWAQTRLREIASPHPAGGPRFFETMVGEAQTGAHHILEDAGYQIIRYGFQMVRPDLEDIPSYRLPDGLEVRPVLPEHYRKIWEADTEAFRDHWNFVEPTETDYEGWLADKVIFTPALWKIAWDKGSNEICGQVKGFINAGENQAFGRLRGYCEFISVRRPWRRQGVARALIALTLREFKDHGMREAALDVDAANPNGAVKVYEDCGFRVAKRAMLYRKPLG